MGCSGLHGQIGRAFARIMAGFGCHLLVHAPCPIEGLDALGAQQIDLDRLIGQSDIVSLHCPLTASSHHLIGAPRLPQMKPGVMLINTGRGALVATLKSGQLSYPGLDVDEEEADLFFEDCSDRPLQDDVLARLLTFPNVILTAHQAYLTHEALAGIARTTLDNIAAWAASSTVNEVPGGA